MINVSQETIASSRCFTSVKIKLTVTIPPKSVSYFNEEPATKHEMFTIISWLDSSFVSHPRYYLERYKLSSGK